MLRIPRAVRVYARLFLKVHIYANQVDMFSSSNLSELQDIRY